MTAQQPNLKLTDEAVGRLPLASARAELLEEIMSMSAPDRIAPPVTPLRSRRRWMVPAAAAAVVAALAVSTAVYRGGPAAAPGASATASTPSTTAPVESSAVQDDYRAVLDAPGWTVTSTETGGDYGEVNYTDGSLSVGLTWYAASSYQSYVEDREHIVSPPAPGQPVQVLGASGQMWAYSDDDHTTIREVAAGHWMEIRGSGMSEAAYVDLLGQLRLVDQAGLEAALPPRFVTTDKRDAAIQQILDGIDDAMGPARSAFPMGDNPPLHSEESDPYQLGAYVSGQVACAWLAQYVTASAAGDQGSASDAVQALATARTWPVLRQMNADGDYPEVIWEYADDIAAGKQPTGYQRVLGCH